MHRVMTLIHEFVEYIPNDLADGTIYVSIAYATVAHKCCCGCGNEVVTPLSPTDWTLTFDGQSIALDPSIGNWSFSCQSHYWIRRNRVIWAQRWSQKEIKAGRAHDSLAKARHFDGTDPSNIRDTIAGGGGRGQNSADESPWRKPWKWLFSRR